MDFPSSSPFVTAVGGTSFTGDVSNASTYWNSTNNSNSGSAISYIPEASWNGGNDAATGGGASLFFAKPSWQAGPGVPADNARDVPDIALAADPSHDGYLVCDTGYCQNGGFRRSSDNVLNPIGGTSAGAPSMAGIMSLLVQRYGSQGNINATLYSLGANASSAFHDITSGTNIVNCRANSPNCPAALAYGYSTNTGYDQVTGWGTIDANNLFSLFNGYYGITLSPGTLSVSRGSSGTASVTVSAFKNFSGAVSFTCSVASTLTNVTCSIPGTVSNSGSTSLSITAGSTAQVFPFAVPPGSLWLFLAAALSLGLVFSAPRRHIPAAAAACALCLILGAAGCGGGSSSGGSGGGTTTTTAQSGAVTVTAKSGNQTATASVTVTVQ